MSEQPLERWDLVESTGGFSSMERLPISGRFVRFADAKQAITTKDKAIADLKAENEQLKNYLSAKKTSLEAWKTEAMDSWLVLTAKTAENTAIKAEIEQLRAAIATPEVYAGVVSETVEKAFAEQIKQLRAANAEQAREIERLGGRLLLRQIFGPPEPGSQPVARAGADRLREISQTTGPLSATEKESLLQMATSFDQLVHEMLYWTGWQKQQEEENAALKARIEELEPPRLARHQPCGCVICTCEGERCGGCGGKHCGTHPIGEIPNPVYERHPLQARIETLESILRRLCPFEHSNTLYTPPGPEEAAELWAQIRKALTPQQETPPNP